MTETTESQGGEVAHPKTLAQSSTFLSARGKAAFAVAVVLLALGYFAFLAFQAALVDYHTVAEAAELSPTEAGRLVGVKGKLVQGTYHRSPDGRVANFRLRDEQGGIETIQVRYAGEIGQVFFNEHSDILLQGRMGADGAMTAETMTVRCPSKYLSEEERAEIEVQNGGQPLPPPYQQDYFSNTG